jgi:hypothetical protein
MTVPTVAIQNALLTTTTSSKCLTCQKPSAQPITNPAGSSGKNTGGGEEAATVAAQAMLLLPPPELQQLHAA